MMRVMVLYFVLLRIVHGPTSPYPNGQDILVRDETSGSELYTYTYNIAWQEIPKGETFILLLAACCA